MAHMRRLSLQLLVAFAAAQACFAQNLNTIQTLHAHNSYHVCPSVEPGPIRKLLANPLAGPVISAIGNISHLDYTMPPVNRLLGERGVRSLEFDLVYDPAGGKFLFRAGAALATIAGSTDDTSEIKGPADFATPGWKVTHLLHIDYLATCYSLKSCLRIVKDWTNKNPRHSPLFIRLEPKLFNYTQLLGNNFNLVNQFLQSGVGRTGGPSSVESTLAPSADHLKAMEAEIRSIFSPAQLYRPDDFRGRAASQQARIKANGWPTLDSLAGKVAFVLVGSNPYTDLYRRVYPASKGALMFTELFPSAAVLADPSTVFVQMSGVQDGGGKLSKDAPLNNRVAAFKTECTRLVKAGFLVRAPADSDTIQARSNDLSGRNAAVECGVHFISTDYPNGHTSACSALKSRYTVRLTRTGPLLASNCNPVTRSRACATRPGVAPPATCSCYKLAQPPRTGL